MSAVGVPIVELKAMRLERARQWRGEGISPPQVRQRLADLTDRSLAVHLATALHDAAAAGAGIEGIALTVPAMGSGSLPPVAGSLPPGSGLSEPRPTVAVRGLALAAVGSLGRRDGGPMSDLDLVLLHDLPASAQGDLVALADRLWYPLWDARLDVDHAVRTPAQCRQVAAHDLTALMGLLDLRAIAGDADLVARVRREVYDDWRGAARRRFDEVVGSIQARTARFGELAHLIEPNLKECRGGLRDVQVAIALGSAWLADRPHGILDDAAAWLLDVRDALQVVTGRPSPLLGRADQPEVAAAVRLGSDDDLLAETAAAGRAISHALDLTLRRSRQGLARPRSGRAPLVRGRFLGPRTRVVAPGVVTYEGETAIAVGTDLVRDPGVALRAAAYAAGHAMPLTPVTQEALAGCGDLPRPWPTGVRADFVALLAAGPELTTVWEVLDQAGLPVRWIPGWAAVRNRPQRNPWHRHTVDRHLVETAARLSPGRSGGMPADAAVDAVLLLAGLLHDLGKIAGARDHAAVGEKLAAGAARTMGFTPLELREVAWLVRHHLWLAETATHRDPSDPAVARDVVALVEGDRVRFERLACLTRADAQAAGPQAWSSGRATLIEGLIARVKAAMP